MTSECWLLLDDFNETLTKHENLGKHFDDEGPGEFRAMLESTHLTEMHATWIFLHGKIRAEEKNEKKVR